MSEVAIYLGGPINGCTDDECMTWRETLKGAAPHVTWVDPMARDYRGREADDYQEIVEGDKADIDRCDAMIVNYVKPSVGTSMEILYAWQRGIPVVVVAAPDAVISPWLRYHSRRIVASLTEALSEVVQAGGR